MEIELSQTGLALIVFAFIFGGLCKGISGIGVPVIAVPVIADLTNIVLAIVLIAIPSVVSNIYQVWRYRKQWNNEVNLIPLCVWAIVGSGVGIFILDSVNPSILAQILGLVLLVYILIRFLKKITLSDNTARRMAGPAGFLSGLTGGTTGVSAPVILMYLSSIALEKSAFIFGISVYFIAMGLGQFLWLIQAELMTFHLAYLSTLTLIPLGIGMWIGQKIGDAISKKRFDQFIMLIMSVLGLKLFLGI